MSNFAAMVVQNTGLSMQLCVPAEWSEQHILEFAEGQHPCGTENGWSLCKDGDLALNGDRARVPCSQITDFVHVVVVA